MTVSYQYEVASSTSGGFTKLLFMWRGSLYKLIYRELLLFLAAFGCLSALYRNLFTPDQKRVFEKIVAYCDTFITLIPLSFVLGFYVAYVAGRWWQQYVAIPWPDKVMHSIALFVEGETEHDRVIRRTLMRYLNLTLILVLRSISSAVKRRFPTMDHLVEGGFMTGAELQMFQSVPSVEFNTYWIPCTWFIGVLKESRRTNMINDSQGLKLIMEEFNEFRSKCGLLWSYDWISIPLVYTQVVTIATYSFFLAALIGRQYVDGSKKLQLEVDIYIPLFTILQFLFFMGLLKVAEQLINPFGDDEEDFELNWLIDRHTKVSYLGVDILMQQRPPIVKDKYFDAENIVLPYTEASVPYKIKTYRGSVAHMTVPENQQSMLLPEVLEEEEEETATSSTRHASPKVSLSNIFPEDGGEAGDGYSTPGTWRKFKDLENGGILIENARDPLERFRTSPNERHWESAATLESYCSDPSINGVTAIHQEVAKSDEPQSPLRRNRKQFEESLRNLTGANENPKKLVKHGSAFELTGNSQIKEDIFSSRDSIKPESPSLTPRRRFQSYPKILARRRTTSGILWRPVLDNPLGDSRSENLDRCSISNLKHSFSRGSEVNKSNTSKKSTALPHKLMKKPSEISINELHSVEVERAVKMKNLENLKGQGEVRPSASELSNQTKSRTEPQATIVKEQAYSVGNKSNSDRVYFVGGNDSKSRGVPGSGRKDSESEWSTYI
nr:PREDICTED: bestrophin-2-like isoform X1 [Bemisia tabaci]XP_018911160.1 PREDICTED: bestrophin-2-like isoform X1 [Bemisia tabaci]XP_018911165.1 PREDICTED: bestrophin-2-like isoform X1 [Bemisia tabaci]